MRVIEGGPSGPEVAAPTPHASGGLGRVSDRVIVPSRPGNSGGGKNPDFWYAFDDGEEGVIGDEPRNARKDQELSEKALLQGEGGARLPLLSALRQDLPRGHTSSRLCAGSRPWGRARRGRGDLQAYRRVGC